ncbi:MAG: VWA domain-containing protein [Chloroflexi bacterium AL-W]|nr:VWA domain-containing protein [Chloroflexi bacterium AL-N1]NOK70685.1 VWA domain-containing protein [Chloroflexi bacterium AL-N10]NOK78504.1 VWA domain-containing protein [Chloroflexi bacterium AL-N5]NOK85588.1 VWA domain-containing protein [Chloroflexi bacterium AL-W]NOK92502.1 VWA domain-containing protein [Chloroflexi bacterium AL-N15]
MSLLAPFALFAIAAIGPIIVAMYLLKLRREERTVSSTFLWSRMVRDIEANAPWQRLRRNWLLLLQLLLLLLLAFALARPFFQTTGIAGRNLIVIVDRSASMGAIDVEPNRLDAAKRQAITLIDQLPDDGRATIIAAGGQMDVPAAATTDRRQLRDAINSITLNNGGGSNLSQALTLASALASREAESEVAIISDGNVQIPQDIDVPGTVRYFPIGAQAENVAISSFSLQPSTAGQTLFVQATNYGPNPVSRRLDVYLDGSLFNAYDITIESGRDEVRVAEIPSQVQVAEARLIDPTENDALALDDTAWATSNAGDETQLRLVSSGNVFLETALDLLPGVQYTTVPTNTTTFTETTAQIPVTILDNVVPSTLPPGNLLFIAPPRSTEFFSVTGTIEFPSLRPQPGDEPLLRNVSLSEVNVLEAARLTPDSWMRTVIDGDGSPIMLAGERDGRRIVVLAFRLQDSDFPLQVAFPLEVSNIMSYLAPGSGADAAQLAPGLPIAIPVDESITSVTVTRPDGETAQVEIDEGQAIYANTSDLGPYTVEQRQGDRLVGRQRYAVNLFAPDESLIAPQAELEVPQESGLQQAVTQERVGRQEIWRWLAAVALVVLIIEWLVYQRNGIVYLRDRWRRRRATT